MALTLVHFLPKFMSLELKNSWWFRCLIGGLMYEYYQVCFPPLWGDFLMQTPQAAHLWDKGVGGRSSTPKEATADFIRVRKFKKKIASVQCSTKTIFKFSTCICTYVYTSACTKALSLPNQYAVLLSYLPPAAEWERGEEGRGRGKGER